jgi:hypothetical protein
MATQAAMMERYDAEAWGRPHSRTGGADPHRLRALPNEDVYFYRKQIDNSRVVREADPEARARAWKWLAGTGAATLLLAVMFSPAIYGLLAGYQIEALRAEQQRLIVESDRLMVEETQLLSPQRLEELAKIQEFIDPSPDQVVYLNPKADGSLALNVHPGKQGSPTAGR